MLLRPGETCWRTGHARRATPLIDTQVYFAAAKSAMAKARGSILLLGWAFDPLTELEPDANGGGPADDKVGAYMKGLACARPDLDVRVLIWKSSLPIAASQHFFPHRARQCFKNTPVRFRLDASVPFGACHHQKVLVIDDAIAFCGGGDITTDRWDSPAHLDADRRRTMPTGGVHDPRHDVMMLVDGEAAAMLGEMFRERWRRDTGEQMAPPSAHAGDDPWPDGIEPAFHDVRLGVARTEPAWRGRPEVRESEALHLAAIAAARRTIYLENQYVASPVVGEALAARLEEPDGPEVVIVSTEHSPSWFDRSTMDKTRSALLRRLQGADRHGRFHAYCPETDAGATIIVHCKVSIIDDVMLRIGSTNLNNRSAGFDTECDVAIEAPEGAAGDEVRAGVRRYRSETIAHFLGVGPQEFDAALAQAGGGLSAAIEALDAGPRRRMRKLGAVRIGPLARIVATFHLGDPVGPKDSWAPWLRRGVIQDNLQRMAPALAQAPLIADRGAGVDEPARGGEHPPPSSPAKLLAEDFIQSD